MYGQIIQREPTIHNDARPYKAASSHSDELTETIEARVIRNSEHLMSLASSVAQDIATLRARSNGGQSGCALTPPDEAVNVERNKDKGSTDVHPCSDQIMGKGTGAASKHSGQQRATSAAVDDGPFIDQQPCPPSTKGAEFHSPKRVQMGVQESGSKQLVKLAAIFKSPFVSQCVRLFPKISHQESLLADYALIFSFPSTTNNHWHVHVLNIPTSRVEILSSLPLRRGNGISAVSRRLSEAIDKAFHAHGMLSDWRSQNSCMCNPKLCNNKMGRLLLYDCGMFAIKYMQHWNRATLAHSIIEHKMHLYRLRLVITLVTNMENNARGKVMKACRM
ncbi:hypothetical protein AAG906_026243 [Vitis piasezkii]